ncbi:alkaline phosphatase [Lewinella marina]|uniref:Alkaline phosphatase n=1 Tax=Neolewinella marina TaxID=438751 RepID=A0A2G0CE85_9BACT|nr:alkaline phosphatase [Neolewinella marina]NJB87397.1 alkaline phosphatase [Neolewinella marina]PHK98291.1 alkaline phosphatase [Neolewinella marina]
MTTIHHWLTACLFLLAATPLLAQAEYRVHSHNDYLQDVPFWQAYSSGAASIEADLILRHDTLYVAHAQQEIDPGVTFSGTYLEELARLAGKGNLRPVRLLIDLKTEAYATLDRVVAAITAYPELARGDLVTFIISGNRPPPEEYANYPDFIYFDHQNLDDLDRVDLSRVAMISQSFRRYSVWNGYGRMTAQDLARVDSVIQRAQNTGTPFRFWATPDTKTAWATFARLGVDYINTDQPAAARAFLDKLDQRTYAADRPSATYTPQHQHDASASPRNIILMIGDGNGLAQISAARMANRGALSLTNLTHIGLVSTTAADDPVTDSAAAGTAMATGVKTNNRAIGVDTAGRPLRSLVERLSDHNYRTGIITTDGIAGATPAAFYAHTPERDDSEKIMHDLVRSDLSFFIAGGEGLEKAISGRFTPTPLAQFNTLERPVAILHGTGKMRAMTAGRGAFLPESVAQSLSVLGQDERPFFLMIEGAQIDNGGHANEISTIVTEMLDFDRAIGEALRFADADGETLVIVTADHETGGLGIAGGSAAGEVRADFLSVDHTGTMVPLFAYGPGARNFTGVFENTEVFHRILAALGIPK